MSDMNAAVVTTFDEPPHYLPFPLPTPSDSQYLVDVVAAGLHPRVRTGAKGAHYSSTGALPMVPGVDAVGRRDDGRLVYFVATDGAIGTMAERAVVDARRAVELPDDIDPAVVAATMNPAMSSWVALRRRIDFAPGSTALVLGATGNAGSMAVQVAKLLGASRVVGAGRNRVQLDHLQTLGADEVVQLTDDPDATGAALAAAAADVDVVIDYLWGEPAALTMTALATARADRSRALDWIQIGAVAGPSLALPSVLLRSSNLRVLGNGQGSVSPSRYVAELPSLVDQIAAGRLGLEVNAAPLAGVEAVWDQPAPAGVRTVFRP